MDHELDFDSVVAGRLQQDHEIHNPPVAHEGTNAAPPKQLSPSIISVLLEDLIEFNGMDFRSVPLRTFRDKYIGLYFGIVNHAPCDRFFEHLKLFYHLMIHKVECVLVSCDTTEDAYLQHTQATMWPTFPRGDYRPLLLRNHFEISLCPTFIVVDPNGMVMTMDGVGKIMQNPDATGFPWCDKVVDTLYGVEGLSHERRVLLELGLPHFDGLPFFKYQYVGLIFGEPWCPETRDLLRRADLLVQQLQSRLIKVDDKQQRLDDCRPCAIYLVHSEDLALYESLPNFTLPCPAAQLDDPVRQAVRHYFELGQEAALVVVSPMDPMRNVNATSWIKRDPTGICFPWLVQSVKLTSALSGRGNLLRELNPQKLKDVMSEGPVFLAMLHNAHTNRVDILANLRAISAAYRLLVGEQEKKNTRSPKVAAALSDVSMLERLRGTLSQPPWTTWGTPEPEQTVIDKYNAAAVKVSWSAYHQMVHRRSSRVAVHGRATWNQHMSEEDLDEPDRMRRAALQFFFSTDSEWTPELLSKFCCFDAKKVMDHCNFSLQQTHRSTEAKQSQSAMKQKLAQLLQRDAVLLHSRSHAGNRHQDTASSPFKQHGGSSRHTFRGASNARLSHLAGPAVRKRKSTLRKSVLRQSAADIMMGEGEDMPFPLDEDSEKEDEDGRSRFLPSIEQRPLHDATKRLLGDGDLEKGVGIILDAQQGRYYVCGDLSNISTVLDFLDRWSTDELDSFELSLTNSEERLEDSSQAAIRAMSLGTGIGIPTMLSKPPAVVPGIVIWVPCFQHRNVRQGLGVGHLFRAMLHAAYQKCPRNLNTCRAQQQGWEFSRLFGGVPEHTIDRPAVPWISKFWVFGLQDGEAAQEEADGGDWEPPGDSFLDEIKAYIEKMVRIQEAQQKKQHRRTRVNMRTTYQTGEGPRSSSLNMDHASKSNGIFAAFEDALQVLRLPEVPANQRHLQGPVDDSDSESEEERGCSSRIGPKSALRGAAGAFPNVLRSASVCFRTASTRRELHTALLDELGHHVLVQNPAPPLFVLFVGNLHEPSWLPWPTTLQNAHVHVVGTAKDLADYRKMTPNLEITSWQDWSANSMDGRLPQEVRRCVTVPWV